MIGVIGGMGPLATVDFMNKVIEETAATQDDGNVPMLASCDPRIPSRPAAILEGGPSPLPALVAIRDRLLAAGATALVMPCNTAHHWHAQLVAGCPVPFLSIVEASCDEARRVVPPGGTVGLLATRATLAARLFEPVLARHGLAAQLPTDQEMDTWVLPAIAAVKGGQLERARPLLDQALMALADRGASHVLLACTELPLALADDNAAHRPACVDTTRALARATVAHWNARSVTNQPLARSRI